MRFSDDLTGSTHTLKSGRIVLPLREEKTSVIYHLVLHLKEARSIRVGGLGLVDFPPGYYIYTGRAQRGLIRRLERHLQRRKKLHWHIDYLTSVARVEQILVDGSGTKTECQRHKAVMKLPWAQVIVPGFGSSDCYCSSHLAYFERSLTLNSV